MSQDNVAIILRGVPGSGKSSFVKLLLKNSEKTVIHAVDDLHKSETGEFLWSEKNAKRNYTLNFANFVLSCSRKEPVVVCDAINIQVQDFQRYVEIAREYDYHVYVVTADPPTPSQSCERNKHHTSSVQAKEMYSRWEHWPSTEMLKDLTDENS